jgi:glutamyl-Q tRNA(Asp) synthetase
MGMETTRFAPSPSGRLHLGHAYAAWFACHMADSGGKFLLRMEDLDQGRCRSEYETAIAEDLHWLGLSWTGPVMKQSTRSPAYEAALSLLQQEGLVYPCFCTRKDIEEEIRRSVSAPHGPEGPLYPGTCRSLSPAERSDRIATGEGHAWRIHLDEAVKTSGPLRWHDRRKGWQEAQPRRLGDVVLARKDAPAAYHLAVVVDDAAQEISLVTRGEDLFEATHVHRLLQHLLGLPVPEWCHHLLIRDENGRRLAKRDDAMSLETLRKAGRKPEELLADFESLSNG